MPFFGEAAIFSPQSEAQHLQASQTSADGAVFVKLGGKGAGSFLNVTGADLGSSTWTGFSVRKVRFCSLMN